MKSRIYTNLYNNRKTSTEEEIIKNALSKKGIKLPQTTEEFTKMLPRYAR